jgi:hypothetical protein
MASSSHYDRDDGSDSDATLVEGASPSRSRRLSVTSRNWLRDALGQTTVASSPSSGVIAESATLHSGTNQGEAGAPLKGVNSGEPSNSDPQGPSGREPKLKLASTREASEEWKSQSRVPTQRELDCTWRCCLCHDERRPHRNVCHNPRCPGQREGATPHTRCDDCEIPNRICMGCVRTVYTGQLGTGHNEGCWSDPRGAGYGYWDDRRYEQMGWRR